uniref:Uncharacterized protein n=1 Tax=Anopheles darlingi TaxID=43151 RepID=A0A2M4DBR6_ANODA
MPGGWILVWILFGRSCSQHSLVLTVELLSFICSSSILLGSSLLLLWKSYMHASERISPPGNRVRLANAAN